MNKRNRQRIGYRGRLAKSLIGRQPNGVASTLLTGLLVYWKLDEASGNRADSGPNGLALQDFNTVTQGAGIKGNAAQFTAANSEYLFSNSALINPPATGDYTISFWVNLDTNVGTYTVLSRYGVAANRSMLVVYSPGSGKYIFYGWDTAPTQYSVGTATSPNTVGQWYHIVCIRDYTNSLISIIVNDGTVSSAAMSNAVPNQTSNQEFRVGQDGTGTYFNGRVDELGFWNRKLTAAEITALYNGGAGATYPAF